jgi:hypothetical protein
MEEGKIRMESSKKEHPFCTTRRVVFASSRSLPQCVYFPSVRKAAGVDVVVLLVVEAVD